MINIYVRSNAVVSRKIAGETLVVPVRGGVGDLASIYSLNEVGSVLWEALANPSSLQELVEVLENEYGVSTAVAEGDVKAFLEEMETVTLVIPTHQEQSVALSGNAIATSEVAA